MKTEDKIFNYIKSNQEHSTLVGKMIMVSHADKEDDYDEIMEFSKWMASFMKKVENFNKNNK